MEIKDLIKCISSVESKSLRITQLVAELTDNETDEKIGDLLTNLTSSSIMFRDLESNLFVVDTNKFVNYVLNNKAELINDYNNERTVNNEK